MLMGFTKKRKVLKLTKMLYRLCQSPWSFWQYLMEKGKECGTFQIQLDTCLFVRKKCASLMSISRYSDHRNNLISMKLQKT